jgi:hypothetical protein
LTLEFSRYLFGEGSVFRFDMPEFLHLDRVKLFMGDEIGSAGRLGKSSRNTGKAFSRSMKSRKHTA